MRELDGMDRDIIKFLQQDGRMPYTDIARHLNVTETTVRKRVSQMLNDEVVTIVAVPRPETLGTPLSAIIGVSAELTLLNTVAEEIRKYPSVRYVGMSAGRYDLIVETWFSDQQELLDFVTTKLGQLDGVLNIETSIILKIVKFSYEWVV